MAITVTPGPSAVAVDKAAKPVEPPEPTPLTANKSAVAVLTAMTGRASVRSVTALNCAVAAELETPTDCPNPYVIEGESALAADSPTLIEVSTLGVGAVESAVAPDEAMFMLAELVALNPKVLEVAVDSDACPCEPTCSDTALESAVATLDAIVVETEIETDSANVLAVAVDVVKDGFANAMTETAGIVAVATPRSALPDIPISTVTLLNVAVAAEEEIVLDAEADGLGANKSAVAVLKPIVVWLDA